MALIGNAAPDFTGKAAFNGEIIDILPENYKGKWLYLFFYPLDFTFVCPTELVAVSDEMDKFKALNCDVLGVSVDSVHTHLAWMRTERADAGIGELAYPLLSDLGGKIADAYGVLGGAVALRGAFLIDPEGNVQHSTINNLSVGRSVSEMLRVVSAFQYTVEHGEVCPANWTPGEHGMAGSLEGVKKHIG